ncbi:MAG: alpha-galactosidase [Planctomycetota bacterium]|nr:alpha-galactosidase [Planctomycetota bacterium]
MPRIVIIGAGSGFGSRLSFDILSREPLRGATIVLADIDAARLEAVTAYVRRAVEAHGVPAKIESAIDHRDALPGADFVITSVSVGGAAYAGYPFAHEINIPRKYGVDQSVGDTLGPGGVFRFLRTAPVQLGFCRDMEDLCPDALLLNYTNPMGMLTWLHSEGSSVRNVGLCHSIQWTMHELAGYTGIPLAEITHWVAGINHQAWVLEFRRRGQDAYPAIRQAMETPETFAKDRVRFEMMRHFGYFVTESSHHNSEYLPYFRRTQELRDEFHLESRQVPMEQKADREWMKTGPDAPVPELARSNEYASGIIEALVTGVPLRFNGNVMNTGLITNLPEGCCVEVPCVADREGVHPCHVGPLPPPCAALNRSNVAVQELAVRAVLDRDRNAAFHAIALDPLTASCLSLAKIREMFEEMWAAERELLSYFDE